MSSRDATDAMFELFFITQTLMLVLIALVLPLEIWAYFCESRRTNAAAAAGRRMQRNLLLNALLVTVLESAIYVSAIYRGMDQTSCDVLAKAVAIFYVLGSANAYFILLQKVKLVSVFHQTRLYHSVVALTELVLYVAMPTCVIFYGWVIHGQLTQGQRCMQRIPPWTLWAYAACNFVLSCALLYLFIAPANKLARSGVSLDQTELQSAYRRNLVINLVAVLFTLLSLLMYGVAEFFALQLDREDLLVLGLMISSWDMFVLALCFRVTTTAWLPKSCASRIIAARRPRT